MPDELKACRECGSARVNVIYETDGTVDVRCFKCLHKGPKFVNSISAIQDWNTPAEATDE